MKNNSWFADGTPQKDMAFRVGKTWGLIIGFLLGIIFMNIINIIYNL